MHSPSGIVVFEERGTLTPKVLDLSGLRCPIPALRTKRTLAGMRSGQRLEVICTDPLAKIDIPYLLSQTKHKLLSSRTENERLIFLIDVS
jgi:tRNA 2-thiouridine synthesizing protein A